MISVLGGRFEYFYFFLLGEGEGGVRGAGRGGGGSICYWKCQEGGGLPVGEGRSAANWGIWGAGAKYFFSGPKCPPSANPALNSLFVAV